MYAPIEGNIVPFVYSIFKGVTDIVRTWDNEKVNQFELFLKNEEKSEATVKKYLHDVLSFAKFIGNEDIDREKVMEYKHDLCHQYTVTSANSMIAALNTFFHFCGWNELCVKQFRVQRAAYCSEEKELTKEEYIKLLRVTQKRGDTQLNLIIQTICATGIRVGELQCITVDAIKRGEAVVDCKGKCRRVFIVTLLRKKLLRYIAEQKIQEGPIFVSKNGKPISRTIIWRKMKSLCHEAQVNPQKVFPHNLRHLFARIFYAIEKDIAKLADILGHANINTTRVYIITTGAEHRRKMEYMKLII